MKKVVLINQSTGYLMIDVANAYASEYDEVVLLAGSIKRMERELDKSVSVKKIIAYNRNSTFKRIFTWLWSSFQIFFLMLFKYRKYEVVYFTNPPIAYLSSLLLKNRFSIVVYDIYPDALKNIGIKENNYIYKLWSRWNKTLFDKAEKIITLSDSMASQLSIYVNPEKINVIANWSGSDKIKPFEKSENIFIERNRLQEKFVVMYSGNIGYTHSVEAIIDVAIKLQNHSNIHFMIIGEGMKKEELKSIADENELLNCTFLTWQPYDLLPHSLSAADLAVISLNDATALLSVPSKTYNFLAAGAPLLCIAPQNSELASLIEKYENGACFDRSDIADIEEFIIKLSKDKGEQKRLSDNSIAASSNFSFKNAQLYL